jgi:hypothetical protein
MEMRLENHLKELHFLGNLTFGYTLVLSYLIVEDDS